MVEIDKTDAKGSFKYNPINNEQIDNSVASAEASLTPNDNANVFLFEILSPFESKILIAKTTDPDNRRKGIIYGKDSVINSNILLSYLFHLFTASL